MAGAVKGKPMIWRDSKGRDWTPRIDGRVLRDFDRATGGGFFGLMFDLLSDLDPEEVVKEDGEGATLALPTVIRLSKAIFGKIEHLQILLYEACRGDRRLTPGLYGMIPAKVSFDDFCEGFDGDALADAMKTAIILLLDFFPEASGEGFDAAKDKPSDFLRGRGSRSTK
jgi:hypothetical protein